MKKFAVIHWAGHANVRHEVDTAEEVAKMMELDTLDVEWAIETYGRVDTDEYTAWMPDEEAGIEFPTAEAP